ncbi:MAG: ArsC/Spx/MgsR family protein [Candidatus Latescibacterota bacterium]|nr:ArsC/Spx/MgsR family protein [Candidatus Latescibacterota bacterium]
MLEILRARNVEFDVIEYIKNPPGEETYRRFLQLLGCEPVELLHEGSFKKLGHSLNEFATEDDLVRLLTEHPEVMQRPICVRGARAVIARPAEKVEEILD